MSKKYFYMLLLVMASAYDSLTRLVTGGYYGTAPFSEWTYTFFIQLTSPLVISIMIFMMTSIFSEKEFRARKILFSASISQSKYYILKSISIIITFIVTALIPIIISFLYYKVLFNYTKFFIFMKSIIWFLIPSFIFLLGLAMALGKINIRLLYGLIPIAFLLGTIDTTNILPQWLDIFGAHFFKMATFADLFGRESEVASLNIPNSFIYTRIIFITLGIIFLIYTCMKSEKE